MSAWRLLLLALTLQSGSSDSRSRRLLQPAPPACQPAPPAPQPACSSSLLLQLLLRHTAAAAAALLLHLLVLVVPVVPVVRAVGLVVAPVALAPRPLAAGHNPERSARDRARHDAGGRPNGLSCGLPGQRARDEVHCEVGEDRRAREAFREWQEFVRFACYFRATFVLLSWRHQSVLWACDLVAMRMDREGHAAWALACSRPQGLDTRD
jgi:hypothetical protein